MPLNNFDFSGLGIDQDPELLKMIMQRIGIMQQGFDLAERANQPYYDATAAAQKEAAAAKTAFQTEFDKPDPRVPAGQAGLQRGLGSAAELLSPGKGFKESANTRLVDSNKALVTRRVQRLQMLEKAADETAKRAQQMGDNTLYMKSLKEGEKYAKLAGEIGETVGGYHKILAEHKGRMAEIRERNAAELRANAQKFRLDMMREYGLDTENATPGQLQAIKAAFKEFDAEVQSAIAHQKALGEGIDSNPDAGREAAQQAISAASQRLMETLTGMRQERQSQQTDMMDTVRDFMADSTLDQARKELKEMSRNGKISGIDEAEWFATVTNAYKDKDRIVREIKRIEKDLNNRKTLRFKTPQTIIDQLVQKRATLVDELRSKYGLDVQTAPAAVDGITVQ